MSSGNPFRASPAHSPAAASPVPQTSFITADSVPEATGDGHSGLEGLTAPPLKTKKHVRIESNTTFIPHPDTDHANDSPSSPLVQRPNEEAYAGDSWSTFSPTSLPRADLLAGQSNARSAAQGRDMATTDAWAGSRTGYQQPQSTLSPGGIPANPFARTLASLEPQEGTVAEDRTATQRPAPGANRASLDVESFKNLLMTGKSAPRQSGQSTPATAMPSALGGSQFESSSTDTSSTSRQSLFEPPHETHTESPRTSYEMAESDEDERMGLVSEVKKGKKKPPPAPKHRHGKLVTQRQPQTVSFDTFSASEILPPAITRPSDSSDVNKPLPPTPVASSPSLDISTQDTTPQRPTTIQQYSSESLLMTPDLPRPQKKTPPPVPLARRQSQLRSSTAGNRLRSNSSLAESSSLSVNAVLQSPNLGDRDPTSVAKSPPPPPRSRHGARLTDITSSSANSSSSELPQRSNSVRTAPSVPGPSSSRRSTLDSEPASPITNVRRTSSITSNRNAPRVVSNESTGSTMPPPPPPPRRRQSNRSSLDQQRPFISSSSPTESRRTSIENRRTSLDNNRRTSVASENSLRREYAPIDERGGNEYALSSPNEESENRLGSGAVLSQTTSDSSNILDDMDKFQKEIEELRLKYKKAG